MSETRLEELLEGVCRGVNQLLDVVVVEILTVHFDREKSKRNSAYIDDELRVCVDYVEMASVL